MRSVCFCPMNRRNPSDIKSEASSNKEPQLGKPIMIDPKTKILCLKYAKYAEIDVCFRDVDKCLYKSHK